MIFDFERGPTASAPPVVGAPGEDEALPRRMDVVHVDGARAVRSCPVVGARSGEKRVHQPRPALRLRPHHLSGRRREALPGLLGACAIGARVSASGSPLMRSGFAPTSKGLPPATISPEFDRMR